MIVALLLGVVMFLASLALHLGMLQVAGRIAPTSGNNTAMQTLGGQLVVLTSHLLVALLFAGGFALAVSMDLGGFAKETSMGWMDYYYYSLINVTTVGIGQIYPTGHLRVLTGIESLTGFLIISCSAQLLFKSMKQQEE